MDFTAPVPQLSPKATCGQFPAAHVGRRSWSVVITLGRHGMVELLGLVSPSKVFEEVRSVRWLARSGHALRGYYEAALFSEHRSSTQ